MALPNIGVPNPGLTGNPYTDAGNIAVRTQDFIETELAQLRNQIWSSGGLYDTAYDSISNLEDITFDLPPAPPDLTTTIPDLDYSADFSTLHDPDRKKFGSITPPDYGSPPTVGDDIPDVIVPTIDDFVPSVTGLSIPQAPGAISVDGPGDPDTAPTLTYPTAPTITLPNMPSLEGVNIPTFTSPTLPTFDATYPSIEDKTAATVINWTEPTYSKEIIDEAITQIQVFLAGGSGIDADIEDAIVARGRDREDRLVVQQEQQATEEWANRGYSAPPGMLVQRLDEIREEGLLKKLGLQREVVIKVFETEVENLRFAVTQGIEAEKLFVQMFLAANQRLFEVERLNVQWLMDLYNIQVAVYNARLREVEIRAAVFRTQVEAALAEIEVFKALVEGELAKAEINKSLVQAYTAEIQARESLVNIYEAQVRAVGVQADVYGTQIQAYRGKVEAYAAEINAEKTRFDAYEAQVRGELGKASIVESEARAYQAEIQGQGEYVRAQVENLRGAVAAAGLELQAYESHIRGDLGIAEIDLNKIRADATTFAADTQRYVAQAGYEEAKERTELGAYEAVQRTTLAYYDALVRKYAVDLEAVSKEAELAIQATSAAGQLSTTIAAGALAAMHVSASISGSGGVSAQGSEQVSWGKECNTLNSTSTTSDDPSAPVTPINCSF